MAHGFEGSGSAQGFSHLPIHQHHILTLSAQGIGQVVLWLHGIAWSGGACVCWNPMIGILQGEAFHPASEGRFLEENEIFRGICYSLIDTVAVHGLLLVSLSQLKKAKSIFYFDRKSIYIGMHDGCLCELPQMKHQIARKLRAIQRGPSSG